MEGKIMETKKQLHILGNAMLTAREEYLNWITGSKILLLVFLFVYAKGQITDSLLDLVKLTGDPLQVFEPGIAFLGSRSMMMVLPLVYLVLMGDFPRNDGNKTFFIIRTGKGVWFMGQIFFAFASGITIVFVCVLAVTLPCIGNMIWNGGNWSEAVTKYYLCEDVLDFKFSLITEREYNHMMPGMVFLHSILLVMLFLFFMSVLQLLFSVYGKKIFGFALVGCIVTIGNALAIFENQKVMWYFPCANTQIWLRHVEILNKESASLIYSYCYFLILITVLVFCSWKILKKSNTKI